MYNKNTYLKTNDKKILHKSGKQWVTVSIAMLALLGGGAVASRTTTHAATTQGANTSTTVQVKNRMNANLAKTNQTNQNQQPSNNKPTVQNITSAASNFHANLLNQQNVDHGTHPVKMNPKPILSKLAKTNSTPTSTESSATSSNADSKSVASESSSASASSNNDATNTYVIPKNNLGWDYVQDGVKDQVPNSESSSSATSGSASNNSASAKPSFNSAYQSYEAQMGSEDATVASMNDKNANKSNNNSNKAVKPVLKDDATNYFSGGVTKTGNDDGLNYKVYANGGVEITGGTAQSDLSDFTIKYDPMTESDSVANFDLNSSKAIRFDDSINTNNVTNMSNMFAACDNLQLINFGNKFNTSNVTSMNNMFSDDSYLHSLTLPNSFDTSKVTNMSNMFNSCGNLQSINFDNKFDTSKVTSSSDMFSNDNKLSSLTITSSDTKLDNNSDNNGSDVNNVFLPHMYQETGIKDNTGKPLTLYNPHDFRTGTIGTFTTNQNAALNTFSDIYQSTDDNPNVDMTGYTLPNTYAYVDAQGKISKAPVKDSKGHIMVAPAYRGVTYKYNSANNSVEFIDGSLNWNSDTSFLSDNNYDGQGSYLNTPSVIRHAKSIKFDSDIDTSKTDYAVGMFSGDSDLKSLDLGNNFDTSNVTDMQSMFWNDFSLKFLNLGNKFNTSKITNSLNFDGMFLGDDKLQAINIGSSNTIFPSDVYMSSHTRVVNNHFGSWQGPQPHENPSKPVNLADSKPHLGLWFNTYTPPENVTDTINFINSKNNKPVGTLTFPAPHKLDPTDIAKIPSGYELVDPTNSIFRLNNTLLFNNGNGASYNVPVKSAPVTKDTDYIHFEDANSKAVVEPTLQVTGNDKSNYNVQANQIPKNYKLATTNNGNGFVMNNGDHVIYVTRTNTDNGDPDVPISSNTVTFNGTIDLHFHNGNSDIKDIDLPYSIATANNQTIQDLLNGTNPYAVIPKDYLDKVINKFNTANFTYDNNTDSKEYDNVVVNPNVSSYKTGTNGDTINNGTITLNFSPNNMNEKVNYSYNGKNEGSYTFNGPNDTKGSDTTGQGIKPGYHIAPNNPDNSWIYGNEGAHNDTDTVNVVPNNINGTATVTLVYKESDGTVDDTETKQIPINSQVGGKQIVDPWDYARDNYTQPNSDWIITFPSNTNETSYSLTHTFTYYAQTAPELEIRYVDVDPNATPTKGESTDKQGRPIISTNTYSGSQLQKKNGNIKWIVGNTVTIDDTNSQDTNALHLIKAPKGFHLDEHQQGFDYQNGSEKITLEPNATDSTGHPMILMSIGMFNPFSNHKKPTNPVKPASSASAKPSSASVAPSSKASSASSSVAPSSKASTTPSSSSVAPSSESASVAPSSANNTVIYYNPTSVTNNSIESAPSEASVASVSATPKSTSASTKTDKVSTHKARPNRSAKLVKINHKIHKNIKKTNKVVANKPSKIARYKVVVKNGKPALKTANITNRVASDNAPVKHAVVESTTTKSVPDNQSFMMKVPNSNQKVQVQVNNTNKLPQTNEATNNTMIASIIMLLASVVLAGVSIDRKHNND